MNKRVISLLGMLFCLLFCMKAEAIQAGTVVIPTDVTQAREGCVLVGVEGSYAGDVTEVLNRINAIRLEACQNGYPNPNNPSVPLTMNDYVPLQWSSDLEYIARIRAAEASLLTAHARPNGLGWSDLSSPNGITAYNEVLAWQSWTGTLVDAVDNWYSEKATWVSGGNGVTGHYTSMIDPDARYTGIATFNSPTGSWLSSSAGKFCGGEGLDTTAMGAINDCIQVVEVQASVLSTPYLLDNDNISSGTEWELFGEESTAQSIKIGDKKKYDLAMDATCEGDKSAVFVLGAITWSTSDSNIATVDSYGNVSFVGDGTVTIGATAASGQAASVTVKVTSGVKKTSITSLKAGKKSFTVKWKKKAGNGYEVQYSTKKNFTKNTKTKKIGSKNKTQVTIRKLKSKKKYYVRVRTVKIKNGKKYYSEWSKVKSVKVR